MIDVFRQYAKIIGNAFIGIAFGFSFFYLFLNFYHYQEIRREVYVDFQNDNSIIQLNEILERVSNNTQKFDANNVINYNGDLSYSDASLWKTRITACINSFNNKTYQEIKNKENIDIKDVYNLRESYTDQVLNGCVVNHLYSLIGNKEINSSFIQENQKLLQYYMDDVLQDTSYLRKELLDNSSYHFKTDMSSLTSKNNVKDGFYEVISSKIRAAKLLEIISEWYANSVGGVQ